MMNAAVFKRTSLAMMMALALAACGGGGGGSGGGDNGGGDGDKTAYQPYACSAAVYDKAKELRTMQIMVEAYIDGDSSADYDAGYGTSAHKGDLQGITNNLDYIKGLGINAIWLTPIFESTKKSGQDEWADRLDATGYFTSNYFKIDPNFGTLEQARTLVDEAHKRGMYVFLDGVFGHHKDNLVASPSGLKPKSKYQTGSTSNQDAVYSGYQEDDTLKFYKEVATYWINELKIDGWRLDQAYQVPVGAWGEIRKAVEEASASVSYTNGSGESVHPLGYMFGELWNSASDIAKNGYGTTAQPGLCSNFDFPLRYSITETLAVNESNVGKKDADALDAGFNTRVVYPSHAVPNVFLTNHDVVRFGDLLQRGQLAEPSDSSYWDRHKAAYAFMAASSGPLTFFYGEEIGDEVPNFAAQVTSNCAIQGLCDDHVSRSSGKVDGQASVIGQAAFAADSDQKALRTYLAGLMSLRAAHPALYQGTRTHLELGDTSVLYTDYKKSGDDVVLFILNTSEVDQALSFSGTAVGSEGDLVDLLNTTTYPIASGSYSLTVPKLSALFLQIKTPSTTGPDTGSGGSLIGTGDLADCTKATVSGDGPLNMAMYIRGTYDGGNSFAATPADHKFAYKGDSLYQVVVNEAKATSFSFKFAASDWKKEFAVKNSSSVKIAQQQEMAVASGNGTESPITIPEAGRYVYSFRINSTLDGGDMMVSKCAE